jgi:HD-GYP domain-containing protein (c-di-GMP phosphodiesterase class II)
MTSMRPYRHALTTGRGLEEIAICAGSQFDPMVAEVFLQVWSEETVADLPAAAVAS